jgi:peptidoglycan/LPS O-acetylase OafA/YrhL
VLFHYGWLACGWMGVQIFFVLSGYLITNILLHQKTQPLGVYLKRFYWRRVLRIFPLYYAYLAVAAAGFLTVGEPDIFGRLWKYLFTYTYNFARLMPDDPGGLSFVHFWSLAIEEQFYLLWPTVVFLLPVRAFRRFIVALIVLGPLLRLAAAIWARGVLDNPDYAGRVVNMVTTSHLDAFAWGGSVAVFGYSKITNPLRVFRWALAGALVLGFCFMAWRASVGHPIPWSSLGYPEHPIYGFRHLWGYSVINAVSALAILAAVRGSPPARFLNSRPMVRIGKVSYGVYVFHLPLLWVVKQGLRIDPMSVTGVVVFLGYFLMVMLVSELSFRFFESQFLGLKDRFGGAPPGAAAGG